MGLNSVPAATDSLAGTEDHPAVSYQFDRAGPLQAGVGPGSNAFQSIVARRHRALVAAYHGRPASAGPAMSDTWPGNRLTGSLLIPTNTSRNRWFVE